MSAPLAWESKDSLNQRIIKAIATVIFDPKVPDTNDLSCTMIFLCAKQLATDKQLHGFMERASLKLDDPKLSNEAAAIQYANRHGDGKLEEAIRDSVSALCADSASLARAEFLERYKEITPEGFW